MQPGPAVLRACKPGFVEMLQEPHVADGIQRHAAREHQPVGACRAQQMIDHMDHRVLEHQLRRGRLVEPFAGVGPVMDVLDAQYRVGIPELIGFQRLAENLDQRRKVGIVMGIAAPVGHRAVEPDLAVGAEIQNLAQPCVIGIAGAVHVAPGSSPHVAALARQPGPAALGRGDHAVERADRVEHAVIAVERVHRAVLHDVERDRTLVAGAVDHRDGNGVAVVGEGRGGE